MASLKLSHIYKVYDNGHKAVNDFNIDIKDQEFIVFVGPSGCGKSTTLRMIAGLEEITSGDLFIGDTLVNDMEPKDRDIAFVFQNYALYPHMTVYENMAFGLRNRHVPEEEIRAKVQHAAEILDIVDYLDRKPKAMSGGQRQRVALGRAIVRDPKVFLLDEPLSNLDAKLRAQMRTQITKLHKSLGTTFIYVTHDQVEAMTMGTRIVVMKLGYVQQIDTPMNLYNKPYNKFVAGFIGSPQMNFFDVTLLRNGDKVTINLPEGHTEIDYNDVCKVHTKYLNGETKSILGIRPEHISISDKETGVKVVVSAVEHLGNESIIYGELGENVEDFTMKDEGKSIIIKTTQDTDVKPGDLISVNINPEKIHLFDSQTEITIVKEIPEFNAVEGKIANGELSLFDKKVALNPRFAELLADGNYNFEIPPESIVPGNDFSLKVAEIEELENGRLAHLEFGDRFIFALVDESVQKGKLYHFSILNDKIDVYNGEEKVVEAVPENEALNGRFEKQSKGRDAYDFFYTIEGVRHLAPEANGFKMNAVEKNAVYRKQYKYVMNRDKINVVPSTPVEYQYDKKGNILPGEFLVGNIESIQDYGNRKYAIVNVNGQQIRVNLPEDIPADVEALQLIIDGNDIEVWQLESNFRIC